MHDSEPMTAEPDTAADLNEPFTGNTLGDAFYAWLTRYELLLMGLLVVGAIVASLLSSLHKPLWYDEIFTVIVATQPTWHKFAQAMPAEGNPPLNTLLTMLCVHLFGLSEVVVRLPVLLGFVGAMAGLFVFVRREAGAPFGLMAVTLFLAEPVWSYSFEARPYGLLMGLLMLTLVSYQSATRAAAQSPPRPRALALTGIVVGLAGSIFAHNIGIVEAGIPLLFGEAMRTWQRRRVDWPVVATGLAVIPAMAITLPMIRRTGQVVIAHAHIFEWPLTFGKLHSYLKFAAVSYKSVADPGFFLMLLLAIALLVRPALPQLRFRNTTGPYAEPVGKTPAYLYSAIIGTSLLIPITWVAMLEARGWYFCRYGIGTVLGVIILFSLLLRASRMRQSLLVGLVCVLSLASWIPWTVVDSHHNRDLAAEKFIREDTSGLPFVASNNVFYPPLWWYAPAAVKSRIVMLYDKADPGIVDAVLLAEKPLVAMTMVPDTEFLATHDHFLLIEMGLLPDTLLKSLERSGYLVTLLRREDDENKLYDVHRGPA